MTTNYNDLRNETEYEFIDISSEAWREYEYPDGAVITISEPVALHVRDSGSHRLVDSSGVSHRITPGFVRLSWKAKNGEPHFVK